MPDPNEVQDDDQKKVPAETPAAPSAGHGQLFPEAWTKRIPVLAVASAALVALAAIGHTLGGLGELAHVVGGALSPASSEHETPAEAKVETASPRTPVSFTLVKDSTSPLDGYQLVGDVALPAGVDPGPILPAGAKVRLVLQAADAGQIVQVDRVALVVKKLAEQQLLAFDYSVDPLKQSGFGAAQPHQFYVRLTGRDAEVFYIGGDNVNEPSNADNILPPSNQIFVLDQQAGLQETLDLNIKQSEPGVYQVHFKAHATSGGKEYDLEAGPIYIVHK